MALVTTKEMFEKSMKEGYAIGAFNVNNMEIIQAIMDAAAEAKSPVILHLYPWRRANGPRILRPCGLLHRKLRHHRQPGQHHSVHGADGLAPVRDLRQSKCVTRRRWIVRAYYHRSPSTRQPRICCANSPCERTRARSSQTSKSRMFKLNIL